MCNMTSVGRALPAADWAVPLNFEDALDFTEHVRPWRVDCTQVRRGQFRSIGLILSLGPLTLGVARINQAMVRHVRLPADQFSLFMIGRDSEASFLGAQLLRVSDCLCVRGPAEFEAVTRGPFTDLALSFDEAAWLGTGEWYEPLPAEPGGLSIENFGVEWTELLYRRVETALEAAASPARTLED